MITSFSHFKVIHLNQPDSFVFPTSRLQKFQMHAASWIRPSLYNYWNSPTNSVRSNCPATSLTKVLLEPGRIRSAPSWSFLNAWNKQPLNHIRKQETHLGMHNFQAKPQTWLGNWLINARVVRADRWKDPPVRRGGRTGWCQHQGIMLATWLGGRLRCQVPAQRTSALSFSSSTSTVCPQDLLQHPFNFLHVQPHKCHNQQVQTETTWSGDWGALDISAASWVHRGGRQKQSDH